MKMRMHRLLMVAVAVVLCTFTSCSDGDDIKPGEASIISFSIDSESGSINESAKTIELELEAGIDVTTLKPTIVVSEGATVSPASGSEVDFTEPVTFTVTDQSGEITSAYVVTVASANLRKLAFIGVASENTTAAWDALAGSDYTLEDDKAAATWFAEGMVSPSTELAYFSIEAVAGGADLSAYHAIWIQFDGGWWGGEVAQFPNNTNHCIISEAGIGFDTPCDQLATDFIAAVKTYYEAGGSIFLGNFAGSIVDELGVVSSADYAPNNSWGGLTVDDGATDASWGVVWSGEQTSPLFENITVGAADGCPSPFFEMLASGTLKKNRSNQYNLDFGPWAPNGDADPIEDRAASFESLTGASFLITNCGENEGQMIMWPATGTKGAVITALSGTYDWYVGDVSNSDNIKVLTKNTLLYLADLSFE
ncbi:DUF4960 domain-containing protein [Marinoscillum sp. MHG1-6]|uniref:DUF4960 domain-containing protein n=1 Tax=Marinoscillum sp. MHG1-6 TaxID=2959627 RepID=UPI002158411A|nr:DUF4960 domain-containing protein [Marinoscillum sp. MHG1-6]